MNRNAEELEIRDRLRIDKPTKERLEDCGSRKGYTVAELIRMSWRYWLKVRNSDAMPSLTYRTGTKSEIVNVADLMIPADTSDDTSAVCQFFLDAKDDGKSNGPGQRGEHHEDGTTTAEVAQLGRTARFMAGSVCAVFAVGLDGTIRTFCEPDQIEVAKVGSESVNCQKCAKMLRIARQFPLMQFTQLSGD